MLRNLGPAGKIGYFFINSKLTPLLMIAALALGLMAVKLTPREEEPQIVVPIVDIFVGLPGASPKEVENRVTIPLEKRMWEIPGVEYVYSASQPSGTMVTVRFLVNDDLEQSLVKVYEKLASGFDSMAPGVTPPLVKLRSIDDVPVLGLTLWSDAYSSSDLRRIAAEVERELASVREVSEMTIIGGEPYGLRVKLDPGRLASAGLDPGAIAQALSLQNASAPAGSLDQDGSRILVETGAFLRTAEEVEALVVGLAGSNPIYLREVAEVTLEPADPKTYTQHRSVTEGHTGFHDSVTLTVSKRRGADAHFVVQRVMKKVDSLQGSLIPGEVSMEVTRNYGETANEKANELLKHLLGAILAVSLIIAISLGWRGALVVLVSVPVSFALTLFIYYVFGYTLNRVTLFALIFVTGIVVDDSIIVVENIVRHFSLKKLGPLEAAIEAVNEVGNPTILATLTVIASVLPMAFVRGLMGPYMKPMPVGAALAMSFSLMVALVITPWFAYRLLKGEEGHAEEDEAAGIHGSRTYRIYRTLLGPLMAKPKRAYLFLAGITLLLLLSMALVPLGLVEVKMLPFDNKSELQVIVDMPEGTSLEETATVARDLADALAGENEVESIQLYAGTAAPINFNGLVRHYDLRSGPNVADLQVNLAHKSQRHDQSHPIAKRYRQRIREIAQRHGASVKVTEVPPGPPVLSTLVAEIYGPDEATRLNLAQRIQAIFEQTDGVVDVDSYVEAPQPKKIFSVDSEKAARLGIPAAQVVRTLRLALSGEEVGLLHQDRAVEPIPILLEIPRVHRSSLAALRRIHLRSQGGASVPLSELVVERDSFRPPNRYRKNLKAVSYVVGDVAGAVESPVYAITEMAKKIDDIRLEGGGSVEQYYNEEPFTVDQASMKWDGEWHITYEVFRDLGAAFGVVLLLIYLLIVGWFGSFKVPITMMIAIPLSLIGVLPGHFLFGAFFTATSMIGVIALAGIMVRNSVLLIDFVNLSVERGRSLPDALLEAGAVRFRPILLTAGTVVVGAIVILFDPIFQGLAIALMGGAFASTALTLLVVPLVHYLVERKNHPLTDGEN